MLHGMRIAQPPYSAADDFHKFIASVLAAKADINAEDGDGRTPLEQAVCGGNLLLARVLQSLGANDSRLAREDRERVLRFELPCGDDELWARGTMRRDLAYKQLFE